MSATRILELPNCVQKSTVSPEMKMIIEADHVSYLKEIIKKNDIKR
jgi:hypothetical protein